MADHGEFDLNPGGGLDTLPELRRRGPPGDSGTSLLPELILDPNEFRLQRMLRREHLVYGIPSPFVGRRPALELVYNAVRDAVNHRRLHSIGLVGPPGVGKTRLLAEAFAIIDPAGRGMEILVAACTPAEAADGLSVVGQLLRRRFDIGPREHASGAREKILLALEALVEPRQLTTATRHLAFLCGYPAGDLAVDATGRALVQFQQQAIRTFSSLLHHSARAAPQIIVFNRSQFMTPRTVTVVAELVADLRATPTALIFVGDKPTPPLVAQASPAHADLALDRLGGRDMERLARAILGRVEALPEALIEDVVARSSGIPGLLEDNIRLLIQRGIVEPGSRGQPWRVRRDRIEASHNLAASMDAASRARIAGLTHPVRDVLEMASVFGPAFWFEGLLTLLRTRPSVTSEVTVPWVTHGHATWLENVVERAVTEELVARHPVAALDVQTEYSFTHPLDRSTLYDEMDVERRSFYHRVVGQWLSAQRLPDPRPWYEVIASHFELGGSPVRAARFYLLAGEAARESYDMARAKHFLRQALGHVGLDRVELLIAVLRGLGEACFACGDFEEARRVFGALLEAILTPELLTRSSRHVSRSIP